MSFLRIVLNQQRMRLSSYTTYIMPFVYLFIAAGITSFTVFNVDLDFFFIFDVSPTSSLLILFVSLALMLLYYMLFKKVLTKFTAPFLKYLLIVVPICIQFIYMLVTNTTFIFNIMIVIGGIFLLIAYNVFSKRCMAILTDTAIEFVSLLGQPGTIALTSITKLEQKRNILTLHEDFSFLEIAKKTSITFSDDRLDEFEIYIYTKAFNNDEIFDCIIHKANQCGNLKIRQYSA